MNTNVDLNTRPDPDHVLVNIADYVCNYEINSVEAYDTARNCLMDALGCAFLSQQFPECTKLLGPLVEGDNIRLRPSHAFEIDWRKEDGER